jgi:hypothetical protein
MTPVNLPIVQSSLYKTGDRSKKISGDEFRDDWPVSAGEDESPHRWSDWKIPMKSAEFTTLSRQRPD